MEMRIYLTNLGKYNEGELVGKWVTLPIDINEELKSIGVENGTEYEEYFITDYENDFHYKVDEYDDLTSLNRVAEYMEGKNIEEIYHELVEENDYEYKMFNMEDFDDMLHGYKPFEIASMVAFGKFNAYDEYFRFDGYGNLVSCKEREYDSYVKVFVSEHIEDFIENNF